MQGGAAALKEVRFWREYDTILKGFMDFYLHKIEPKRIRVMQRLAKEASVYPPTVDYRKEAWG